MQHRTKLGQVLLQIATVVFFMNATFAYGACCVTLPIPDEVTPTLRDTTSTALPPCHQSTQQSSDNKPVQTNDSPATAKGCCLMCVPMMAAPMLSNADIQAAQGFLVPTFLASFTGQPDPPFRPPILHQS